MPFFSHECIISDAGYFNHQTPSTPSQTALFLRHFSWISFAAKISLLLIKEIK
jgi:hypothetical protein